MKRHSHWSSGDENARRRGRGVRGLLERLGHNVGGAVLDIGCGEGGVLAGYRPDGVAVGVDVDARLVGRARLGASFAARFVVGDGAALPFADDTFDVAILFDVLEHTNAWRAVLAETGRVLRPGGVAYVTAANTRSPVTILDDPHWHLPLVAVLPTPWSERVMARLDPGGLEMGGDHPSFPKWSALVGAFAGAGLRTQLLSNLAKLADPEAIVDPRRRALALSLAARGASSRMERGLAGRIVGAYDRYWARGWAFIATKDRA